MKTHYGLHFAADFKHHDDMTEGNRRFLRALWNAHPTIMRHHFIAGRAVAP